MTETTQGSETSTNGRIDGQTMMNAWTEVVYKPGNAPEYIEHLEAKIRLLENELVGARENIEHLMECKE